MSVKKREMPLNGGTANTINCTDFVWACSGVVFEGKEKKPRRVTTALMVLFAWHMVVVSTAMSLLMSVSSIA